MLISKRHQNIEERKKKKKKVGKEEEIHLLTMDNGGMEEWKVSVSVCKKGVTRF